MSDLAQRFATADLTNCDREPIHIPGSIQPHGALLALDRNTLCVVHAGGDTAGLLGAPPAALLGQAADRILSAAQVARLLALLRPGGLSARAVHAFALRAARDSIAADAIAYRSADLLVLEFEPRRAPPPDDPLALVQAMLHQVQHAPTPAAFCDAIAAKIHAVTGFDRVMVYRFLPDGSGTAIAEARAPGTDSFLGLHYPPSDIPQQARALYLTNWSRLIPDARYAPAPILPPLHPDTGQPLDLSQSVIRSVSPIHRQYLANMGVVGSMSLSLILGGKLWGLIACHHRGPRHLPYQLRSACELFAEMVSAQLETKVAAEEFEGRLLATRIHEELVTRMSREADLAEGLIRYRPNLLDFIPADGVGLWFDGQFTGLGTTPDAGQVGELVAWLNTTANDGVFHSDSLPLLYPPAERFADVASGILALSVSRAPRDYVLWFRPEVIRTVTWAGNPNKPVEPGQNGATLTPRASFAAWEEMVRLHAAPWRAVEVEAAHRLRLSLLEVVLRRIDQLARERGRARELQQQLVEELDLRLKQTQAAAQALQQESSRRAIAERELSQVLHRTVEDQEAERLRIARELHDTLGQSLTLLQLGLEGIGKAAPASPDVQQRVSTLKGLASDVGREVNRLAWEIRPTALDDLGLPTAIRHLLETWSERSNIQFDLQMAADPPRLPPSVETALYRILQEALTNVVRHAEATRVGVVFTATDQQVSMIIEDDGQGFTWEDTTSSGAPLKRLGLLGVRERLALAGGSMEIETAPGKGTTLFIRVPV